MSPKTLPTNCAGAAIYRCASFPLRFLILSKGTRAEIGASCPSGWSDPDSHFFCNCLFIPLAKERARIPFSWIRPVP